MQELRPGLWRWTARHPDWTPAEGGPGGWEQDVACLYYEAPDAVVVIDPLVPEGPDGDRFWRALDRDVDRAARPVAVLLTVFWHERSAGEVVARYPAATLWANRLALGRIEAEVTSPFDPGDALPAGVRALRADRWDEVVYWLPEPRALVAGDILIGAGAGEVRLCSPTWLPAGAEPRNALRPLLDLPIELLLVSHGEPVLEDGRAALARVLEAPEWGR